MKRLKKLLIDLLNVDELCLSKLNKGKKNVCFLCETKSGKYVIKFLTPQFLSKKVDLDAFMTIFKITENLGVLNKKIINPIENDRINAINKFKGGYFSIFNYIDNDDVKILNDIQIASMAKMLSALHDDFENISTNICNDFDKYVSVLFKQKSYKRLLQKCYSEYSEIDAEGKKCLIHGDYAINNVLFKGNDVVGVIDFDNIFYGSREEELIRACRNFGSYRDKQIFISNYLKNCSKNLILTKKSIRKYIIKDFINEICIYYFQSKRERFKKLQFKKLLNESIKEFGSIEKLINEIWEIVQNENIVC